MESKIRLLSEQTINQIAAGEVIENTASVIKELVENSLDAGATDILVEIAAGGRQLIRVRDNGSGMNADDALLCIERHATSKIRAVEDLHQVTSLGFRGEALPSIASISKFTLVTAPQGTTKGTLINIEGGKILQVASVDCESGTLIEIRDLFFNTPARRKFQKSPSHDIQEIVKALTLLALGHPTVKFELISNRKKILSTGSSSHLGDRIAALLGEEFFRELTPLDWTTAKEETNLPQIEIKGYVGMPACSRHNRTGQFLFINKRSIFSPLINYAVREGYGPSLAPNRHPLFILQFQIPGSAIDVNVHPQKKEVRLRYEQTIRAWIIKAVEGAIPNSENFSYLSIPLEEKPLPSSYFVEESAALYQSNLVKEEGVPTFFSQSSSSPLFPSPSSILTAPAQKVGKVVATFPGYILVTADLLQIIDQRAAHARIIFEKLLNNNEKIAIQTLLIPYTIKLTPLEAAFLEQQLESLQNCGLGIKVFGKEIFVIDAIPEIFGNTDIDSFLHDLLAQMKEFSIQKEFTKLVAETASRAAVSRTRRLAVEEAEILFSNLMKCQMPYRCPKGKLTIAEISIADMQRLF